MKEINRNQLRKELIYCMIKQGYFNLDEYEKEMNKLNNGTYVDHFLQEQIYNIIRIKLDEIINSQ